MTPQRAQDVERICQAALEQEPSARAAFLVEACAGDAALLGVPCDWNRRTMRGCPFCIARP